MALDLSSCWGCWPGAGPSGPSADGPRGACSVPDELSSVPVQRAGVVLGCGKTLPNGRDNLYYLRRIAAAAELYRSGKVR